MKLELDCLLHALGDVPSVRLLAEATALLGLGLPPQHQRCAHLALAAWRCRTRQVRLLASADGSGLWGWEWEWDEGGSPRLSHRIARWQRSEPLPAELVTFLPTMTERADR